MKTPFHSMKSRVLTASGVLLLACLFAPGSLQAQAYTIDWYTIDGGGENSTGGVYTVSGTLGQPDATATPMTGGPYSLTGGFWALVAVQTPGAPWLKITFTTPNTAVISWPYPSTGWDLQQNSDLSTTNWVAPSEMINHDGTNNYIIVNPPTGNRFYRLFNP